MNHRSGYNLNPGLYCNTSKTYFGGGMHCLMVSSLYGNIVFMYFCFASGRAAEYCNHRVCLSVHPLTYLKNQNVQTSENFLYTLPAAIARSFSDNSADTLCTSGFVDDMMF